MLLYLPETLPASALVQVQGAHVRKRAKATGSARTRAQVAANQPSNGEVRRMPGAAGRFLSHKRTPLLNTVVEHARTYRAAHTPSGNTRTTRARAHTLTYDTHAPHHTRVTHTHARDVRGAQRFSYYIRAQRDHESAPPLPLVAHIAIRTVHTHTGVLEKAERTTVT